MKYAKDEKCCEEKCKEQAVAYFPVCDPDIPSYPYCRKHLDEVKFKLLIKIQRLNERV